MRIAIGNSAGGVDFKALDREPVYSIVLLLSPEDKPENHLDAMEAIFSSLSQDTFRRFLRQANTSDDVLTLLTETDNAIR
jgi:PTS system fructose-specific IIA component/PTS system nitrogen regulatory IIA component